MGSERRVLMGLVLGAHGIKGAVRILSYAAEAEDIASYGPLEDESGVRKFSLTVVGTARGAVRAQIAGIGARDAATALAAGGRDNGKPGLRPEYHAHYYAAFIIDPDGYRIEAVRHQP